MLAEGVGDDVVDARDLRHAGITASTISVLIATFIGTSGFAM